MNSSAHRLWIALLVCGLLVSAGILIQAGDRGQVGAQQAIVPVETTTTVLASWPQMDLPTSVATADAVVIGEVVDGQWTSRGVQMSEWGRNRQRDLGYSDADIQGLVDNFSGYVYTHSRLRVSRSLKGDFPDGTVEVLTTGGQFKSHACVAPGFPQLHPGTRYILFLARAFYGGYEPVEVYEVHGDRAVSTTVWRKDNMRVEDLLAIIDQHKDDPFPWIPASEELRNLPLDEENHPMIPEEERGIPWETTTTVSPQ